MQRDHLAFQKHVAALDMQNVATSNFSFFNHLAVLSHNPTLRKALTSVVHIVRLGSLHLPGYLDFAALDRSQQLLLDAVRANDARGGSRRDRAAGNDPRCRSRQRQKDRAPSRPPR